jgi:hypothetical protein
LLAIEKSYTVIIEFEEKEIQNDTCLFRIFSLKLFSCIQTSNLNTVIYKKSIKILTERSANHFYFSELLYFVKEFEKKFLILNRKGGKHKLESQKLSNTYLSEEKPEITEGCAS